MEKDEVKVDSDWLSAIDDEEATDAERMKALLDLMGESMERERREKWQAEHEANGGGWKVAAKLDLGLRDLLWLAMVKDHSGAARFLERVAWDLHCPVAFMEYLCRKLSAIGYGGGWMGTKVADSVDVLCLVGSKKFQDAFLGELEKGKGKKWEMNADSSAGTNS